MSIFVSRKNQKAQRVDPSRFKNEDNLQQYIFDNPESILLEDGTKLLVLARELESKSGPIDGVAIDDAGILYLIETKFYKNPDKRTVIAQVLDYGASLWAGYLTVDEFIQKLEEAVNAKFRMNLHQKIQDFFELDDADVSTVMETMRQSLQKADFRFVVLMDKLPDKLKDLILFLNQNSKFAIYAVELEHYEVDDLEVTIPRAYGTEVKKASDISSSVGGHRKWDEESFFETARQNISPEHLQAVQKLYDFAKANADGIDWGTGARRGALIPRFYDLNEHSGSVFGVYTDGILHFFFERMKQSEGTKAKREELRKELATLGFVALDEKQGEGTKKLEIPPEQWTPHAEEIIRIIQKLKEPVNGLGRP